MAEILGRQERVFSLLSNSNAAGQTQQYQQQQQAHQAYPQIDTFRRDEVNQLMTQQNELVRTIRDI
jgi:hypothetical protein